MLRATDAFKAGLSQLEREILAAVEPRDYTVVGWKAGAAFHVELFKEGRLVGRGLHPESPALAVAAALEDKA